VAEPAAWPRPPAWPTRPLIAGIVNVTPDSFSDGGRFSRWDKAVEHGLRLVQEGADLLDIGGESTRPGAEPVAVEEELRRVVPVVRTLAGQLAGLGEPPHGGVRPIRDAREHPHDRQAVAITVDTRHAEVALQALQSGARWVNDVSALADPDMPGVIARAQAGVILMHMRGEPATMQDDPRYDDVLVEVCDFLRQRVDVARAAGIPGDRIWVDPGIGFGKKLEHNLALLRGLPTIAALGQPVMLGASRKRFISDLTGAESGDRLAGSLAASGMALQIPRAVLRVHDVLATRVHLEVLQALQGPAASRARPPEPPAGPA
jgi:dihydropteroate synthase